MLRAAFPAEPTSPSCLADAFAPATSWARNCGRRRGRCCLQCDNSRGCGTCLGLLPRNSLQESNCGCNTLFNAFADWTVTLTFLATATRAFNVYRNMYGRCELPPFHTREHTFQYLRRRNSSMLTRTAEHDRRQNWAAVPIDEDLGEGAMSVSHPATKLFMGDHSRNDFVMPASVTSKISFTGIREHSGIKMYGRPLV